MDYNLLDEDWIPVLRKDGTATRVGIKNAFAQAAEIRQIAASNPMDRVAILRFLLALLYWCRGNPPEDKEPISYFPPEWFDKLDANRGCFNLLGNDKRFYQYRRSGDENKTANYLAHEVPTGTNVWHFRHARDYRDGLCWRCCAMGLLRLPVFSTQGGQGKSPGINQRPPVYVVPVGDSLAETLRLSWRRVADSDFGIPAWEKPELNLPGQGNVPVLMGLTWLPRRVWLDDPGDPEGNCIACARRGKLIRRCVFAGLGSAKAAGRVWNDPHTVGEPGEALRPRDALGSPDAAVGAWLPAVERILGGRRVSDKAKLVIVDFATDRNKFIEATEMEISLQEGPAGSAAVKVKTWGSEARDLGFRLRKIVRGERKPRKDDARPSVSALAAVRAHIEAKVASQVDSLMSESDPAWERAADEYTPMMAAVAKSLSPGYTTAALAGRREIASVRPKMRQHSGAEKKVAQKKRGEE